MDNNTAQTLLMHVQMMRDHQKQQAAELARIANALEAILKQISG